MVKQIIEKLCFVGFIFLLGCSGGKVAPVPQGSQGPPGLARSGPAPQEPVSPKSLVPSAKPSSIPKLWAKRMNGAISDLSLSKNGKRVLVATSPDRDIAGSAHHYLLTLLDSQGRQIWRIRMKSPVKEQDLSYDASLIVVSNYENEMIGIDTRGRILWNVEGMCKPRILSFSKKILCYHDDDAEPRIAFDIFDWTGKKDLSYPITDDILALKLSQDERNLAIALARGQVILLDPTYHPVWQKKVEGEVIDVAVSSGETPRIAVLYKAPDKTQKTAVFDEKGNPVAVTPPAFRAIQLEVSPDGKRVFFYGNGLQGQQVGSVSLTALRDVWKRGGSISSDYSSSIIVAPEMILMGFEEILPQARSSHLLAFDYEGRPKWDLPLATDEGAYLYSHRMAIGPLLLVVGTDDARLSAYRMN